MKVAVRSSLLVPLALVCATFAGRLAAWDYDGHRMVNQLALASLPADFPAFVREPANAERVAFLAGEPDRWRNVNDPTLLNVNGVDHYLDLEELDDAGLDPTKVSSLRYEFARQFAAGRAAHADRFPPIDPAKNTDHSREWAGFAPWAITEYYDKLKSAFSYLKALEELGTPEEVANARQNVIYIMGVMGHYVGDGAQPLHATVHHHGWVGPNPEGYSTWYGIHAWIDGGLIAKGGIKPGPLLPRVSPAQPISLATRPDGRDPMFAAVMDYFLGTQKLVVPLYRLEKDGKFGNDKVTVQPDGTKTTESRPLSDEGRAFIETQLLRGGQMLGAIWLTAWRSAGPDTYLRGELIKRQAATQAVPQGGTR
ncbi:MAG TPA: hypothetical protein VG838_02100 [Opitutaceae bacterium]|nr:hypothetical protein [Opitutaceae bacterium]